MTGAEICAIRTGLGLTMAEFGAHLAELTGSGRAYLRQEVFAWESGQRPVPVLIELALVRRELDALLLAQNEA